MASPDFAKELADCDSDLARYQMLATLQSESTDQFYTEMLARPSEIMPLVYTPTVGAACTNFSTLWAAGLPHDGGLFLRMDTDAGSIDTKLAACRPDGIKAIVVTDGERILGLGDLGANGMGIPIGKMALYAGFGGIKPDECLPVTLDCGTNTQSILDDPAYIGMKQKRASPGTPEFETYTAFVEEFVQAARNRYGKNTLIQWEDFGNHNAFMLLEQYIDKCCCFNDDIQGTASVCLAGLLAGAPRLTQRPFEDEVVLFMGAGEAGCGCASLIAEEIAARKGCSVEEARLQIWLYDSKGLVVKDRASGGIRSHKAPFAHVWAGEGDSPTDLEAAVRAIKPTTLVGVSAQGGVFTQPVLAAMTEYCENPVVMPMSNPTSKAECTPAQAYEWTNGKAIVATGSPFKPVTLADGTVRIPGQGNNVYIFPGVGLGAVVCAGKDADADVRVTQEDMRCAAKICASMTPDDMLTAGCLYPPLTDLRTVSAAIAADFVSRRGFTMTTEEASAAMYAPPAKI